MQSAKYKKMSALEEINNRLQGIVIIIHTE